MNGILADQMGLGKTITSISLIGHLWHMGVSGPFLIVAPVSTLANWHSEFQKWTPSIPVVLYHGTKDERAALRDKIFAGAGAGGRKRRGTRPNLPVVIVSYDIVIRDFKYLNKLVWKYLVVDEAHRLKNFECKLICMLRQLQTESRLLLTGTPLQNSLSELWSLLNFLLPDLFSDLSAFKRWFDFTSVIESSGDDKDGKLRTELVDKLHEILKPFLLRRLKQDVEVDLPQKAEIVLFCSLTPTQRALYQALKDHTIAHRCGVSLNNLIMQLRKVCNHPFLFPQDVIRSVFLEHKEDDDEGEEEEDGRKSPKRDVSEDIDDDVRSYRLRSSKRVSYKEPTEDDIPSDSDSNDGKKGKKSSKTAKSEVSPQKVQPVKRSRSAYNLYFTRRWAEYHKIRSVSDEEEKERLIKANGESMREDITAIERNKLFVAEWASLGDAERRVYEEAFEEEKRVCDQLMWEAEGVEVPSLEKIVESSGKMQLLHRMLPELKAQGHKVLIFSQMTSMLDILNDYIEGMGYQYSRIDGSMSQPDRQWNIDRFNSDPDVFVFLLSTRAGGQGINLASADTVIIYDSDWNPQMDIQAQDRCHRIGQKRSVVVYRFIAANTVDSKILMRARSKLFLERLVVGKGTFSRRSITKLTQEDVKELLFDKTEEKTITEEGIKLMLDRDYIMKKFAKKKKSEDEADEAVEEKEEGDDKEKKDGVDESGEDKMPVVEEVKKEKKEGGEGEQGEEDEEEEEEDEEMANHGFEYVHETKALF